MRTAKSIWVWAALPPVVAVALLATWWRSASPLVRVDLGNGRTVRVYGAATWELTQPLDVDF